MTVEESAIKVFYTGDGVITEFDFGFKYFNATEIVVEQDGEVVNSDDYTVTAAVAVDGGTITFDTAPAEGVTGVIYLDTNYSQEAELATLGRQGRGTLENAFDKVTLLALQLKEIADRCLKLPRTSDLDGYNTELPSTLTARRALLINTDGDGFEFSEYDPDELVGDAEDSATTATEQAAIAVTSANESTASAAAAALSATAAAASETAAAASETAAAASETAAAASETAAAASETAAAASETAAAASETAAAASETAADTSADAALVSQNAAAASATAAAASETAAAASAASINLPSMVGEALNILRANAGETGHEYRTPSQVLTDIGALASADAATQAEQETGSSTTKYVTPGRQKFNPCSAKAWVKFDGTGTPSIQASFGVSSITDTATGRWGVNWTTPFSSTNYATAATAQGADALASTQSFLVGSVELRNYTAGALTDSQMHIVAFGDV